MSVCFISFGEAAKQREFCFFGPDIVKAAVGEPVPVCFVCRRVCYVLLTARCVSTW